MSGINFSSNINSNTNYMSALSEITALLKQDIAENGLKSYHPSPNRLLLKDGTVPKKAERYNRRLLLERKTTKVLDDSKIFNLDTGRFKNKPVDRRFKKTTYKKGALKGKNVVDDVFAKKKEEKDYRYVMPPVGDFTASSGFGVDVAGTLRSNLLLLDIINDNKIKGNYRLIITVNQRSIFDNVFDIVSGNKFWNANQKAFMVTSEYYIWNNQDEDKGDVVEVGDVVHFIFTKEKKLSKKYYEQSYLDAKVGHCLFTPILKWAENMVESSVSNQTKKKYSAIVNKIVGVQKKTEGKRCRRKEKVSYMDKYSKGIPESEIGEICEDLKISIKIEQPFCQEPFFEYACNNGCRMNFRFVNTRLNHIEFADKKWQNINEKSCFKQYESTIIHDRNQLIKIKNMLDKDKEFYVYKKDNFGITCIQTLENNLQLYSEYNEAINQFESDSGLRWCSIDALKYPDLIKFINDGTHFNGTIDFEDTSDYKRDCGIPKNMRHIDMTKAYTQSHKCRWYNGFMLKITDFRQIDGYYDNGMYYITDIDFSGCDTKFIKINDSLSWYRSDNIYTSAELRALEELGGKFKVRYGCWGIHDEFQFSKEMIEGVDVVLNPETNKEFKVPFYSKWAGMNCMQNECKNIWINGEEQLYLANLNTENDIFMSEYKNKDGKTVHEGRISYKKNKINCKKHITAQITAYQRLTMLNQLLKMDFDKLARLCVDGIYYYDHDYENKDDIMNKKDPLFGDKTSKMTFNNDPCQEYLSGLINGGEIDWCCDAKPRDHYDSELFDGAGGDGKTYGNLIIDEGLINVCYVPHSNKLATSMKNIYYEAKGDNNLSTSNHYRVTHEPYAFMFKNGIGAEALKHSVYVIDECSMIQESVKEFMLENLWGKVIFCGDLKCQIEPSEGKQMTRKGFENIAQMSGKNYRFKTAEMLNVSNFLRDCIINKKRVDYKTLPFKNVDADFVKKNYDHKTDMILVSCGASKNQGDTNYNNWWNNYLDSRCKKYKVLNNTRDYKNGDIVFDENIQGVRTEFRNGFTIHSIQGETYEGKIFIDMRRMKDLKMFYTAVSRARYENQIYLVNV